MGVILLNPVPIVEEDEALTVTGKVEQIYEGGVKDLVFKLDSDDRKFYINRGLEHGLVLEELKSELLCKPVTIKYPDYWAPLNWSGKTRHLSKLVSLEGKVIFNELR